jgi:transaldolase
VQTTTGPLGTHNASYDSEIRRLVGQGHSGEGLFFELAAEDLSHAADSFAEVHEQ